MCDNPCCIPYYSYDNGDSNICCLFRHGIAYHNIPKDKAHIFAPASETNKTNFFEDDEDLKEMHTFIKNGGILMLDGHRVGNLRYDNCWTNKLTN